MFCLLVYILSFLAIVDIVVRKLNTMICKKVFTFFLIAYLVGVEGEPNCIENEPVKHCQLCDNTIIKCDGANFTDIDSNHDYEIMNVTHGMVTVLPSMSKFTNLTKLILNYGGMRLLSDGAVANMTKLVYLSLAYNKLIDLDEKTFEGLKSLETLDLTVNRIYFIDFTIFTQEKLPKLRHLKLGKNNIVKIEKDSFSGLSELNLLDLSMNQLENLERFATHSHQLTNLKILNLGYNKISSIPEDFFETMPVLEELVLEHNFITSISQADLSHLAGHLKIINLQGNWISEVKSKCFKDMERLEVIDLSYNRLKELKAKALPENTVDNDGSLLSLFVNHNSLDCSNCNNAWMVRSLVLRESNNGEELLCETPRNVTFREPMNDLFGHCGGSSDASMKSASLFIFLAVLFLLVVPLVAFGMYRLRKQRRMNATLSLGQRPDNPGLPSDKGVFSYRGLKEEFPFSIDEADENRL